MVRPPSRDLCLDALENLYQQGEPLESQSRNSLALKICGIHINTAFHNSRRNPPINNQDPAQMATTRSSQSTEANTAQPSTRRSPHGLYKFNSEPPIRQDKAATAAKYIDTNATKPSFRSHAPTSAQRPEWEHPRYRDCGCGIMTSAEKLNK